MDINMVRRSINVDLELWNAARRKADLKSLSDIVRRLLALWIAGRIVLEDLEDAPKEIE